MGEQSPSRDIGGFAVLIRLQFEEREDSILFRYLGICYGVAIVGTELIGQVWTREELDRAVSIAVMEYGVDLDSEGIPLIREVGPRLAPDMESIAKLIQEKKLPPGLDLGGYFFRVSDTSGGQFSQVQGADSSPVRTLRDALEMAGWSVQRKWMTPQVATVLLQQALAANVDVRVTGSEHAPFVLRMPVPQDEARRA